jgi:hypothetical protein
MNIIEAMNKRVSRRTYEGSALTQEEVTALETIVAKANAVSGLTMRLVLNDPEPLDEKRFKLLQNLNSYVSLLAPKSDSNAGIKRGFYGEWVLLQAVALGLGTVWVGGCYDPLLCRIQPSESETLDCLIGLGHVKDAESEHELDWDHRLKDKRKTGEQLYTADSIPPDWFVKGMQAVAAAPSGSNSQPVTGKWEKGSANLLVSGGRWIDLGIAQLHFELATNQHLFGLEIPNL